MRKHEGSRAAITSTLPEKEDALVPVEEYIARFVEGGERFDALPELITRLRKTKFDVPDVAVEERARPIQGRYPGPEDPVFLCVEILSPPGRIGKLFGKCEETRSQRFERNLARIQTSCVSPDRRR